LARYSIIFIIFLTSACSDFNKFYNHHKANKSNAYAKNLVAKVGNNYISTQEFVESLKHIPFKQQILIESSEKSFQNYLNSYINKEILYQEAKRRGIQNNPKIKNDIQKYEKKILIRALTEQLIKNEIDESEIMEYYENNLSKYKTAEIVQISIKNKSRNANADLVKIASETRAKLSNGADPERLEIELKKYTDISYNVKKPYKITKHNLDKRLVDKVFSLNLNEVSDVIELNDVYYIFKITGAPSFIPYNKLKNQIRHEIRNMKFNENLANFKKTIGVEIYLKNIKEIKSNV